VKTLALALALLGADARADVRADVLLFTSIECPISNR
jgi:hypothetical protein